MGTRRFGVNGAKPLARRGIQLGSQFTAWLAYLLFTLFLPVLSKSGFRLAICLFATSGLKSHCLDELAATNPQANSSYPRYQRPFS